MHVSEQPRTVPTVTDLLSRCQVVCGLILTRLLIAATALLMIFLTILLTGGVTLRYLLATPIAQPFEWSPVLLTWIAMLGIPLLIRNEAISERPSRFRNAPILVQLAVFTVLS